MGHLLCLLVSALILIKSGILIVERQAFTFANGFMWVGLLVFMLLITADWVKTVNQPAR